MPSDSHVVALGVRVVLEYLGTSIIAKRNYSQVSGYIPILLRLGRAASQSLPVPASGMWTLWEKLQLMVVLA